MHGDSHHLAACLTAYVCEPERHSPVERIQRIVAMPTAKRKGVEGKVRITLREFEMEDE